MSEYYIIEDGHPIPERSKYERIINMFMNMNSEESFLIPVINRSTIPSAIRSRVRSNQSPCKVITRRVENGVRVWKKILR